MKPDRPNVLFIPIDDLRCWLGCYGTKWVHTPNMDALAAGGLVFRQAYCQQAVCNPSRNSVLSGVRPDTLGHFDLDHHIRETMPDVRTLPQWFKENGYVTEGYGKIYHDDLNDPPSWSGPYVDSYDYQVFWDALPGEKPAGMDPARRHELFERDREARRREIVAEDQILTQAELGARARLAGKRHDLFPSWVCHDIDDIGTDEGIVAELGVRALRRLKHVNQPFFLAVGFRKPHLPFDAPRKYYDLYPLEKMKTADNPFASDFAPEWAFTDWQELRSYLDIPRQGPVSERKARELIRGYGACTSFTDAQVGRLLDELEALGLRDNTVVVLWGDNGWKLGEHGMWSKHTNFLEDAAVPLILRAPGAGPGGHVIDELVELVDIYPTLCDLCGLSKPDVLEGSSLTPLMKDPGRKWKEAVFFQYPKMELPFIEATFNKEKKPVMGYAVKTRDFRYTEWVRLADRQVLAVELYDHRTGLSENRNVAMFSEYADALERMKRLLKDGWKKALPEAW